MTQLLDQILARIAALDPATRAALAADIARKTPPAFIPNPGPQTEAYDSPADLLLYGGQGGGGKSALLLGLALTQHRRSLILRRHYADLGALTEEVVRFNRGREGFAGGARPRLRHHDKAAGIERLVEFGAANLPGDERSWQGSPHDLLGFDEAVQFLEAQVRFLMGWVRSSTPGQRCRTILASNPPVTAEGQWIVGMFRPWLDPTHPDPAGPGELRWFVTDPDGKDLEVADATPVELGGRTLIPQSRSFIPAALGDNPFLARGSYQATLDAMPEPLRSAVRDGNFMAARRDAPDQAIPTGWVLAAKARWRPTPPQGAPMCSIGVDVAAGGEDETVLAIRHDGWFAPLIAVPGRQTPTGRDVAGLILAHRRGAPIVIIDMGGGYGGAPLEHLRANLIEAVGFRGAEGSSGRTRGGQLRFVNRRSQAWWRFREALDPSQEGGSPIMLPDDPMLVADLTAPSFEIGPNGIKIEAKEKVCARLGRSTDRGDAVVMAWSAGEKAMHRQGGWGQGGWDGAAEKGDPAGEMGGGRRGRPQVVTGRAGAHGLVRR
jgi:hypothetical protein